MTLRPGAVLLLGGLAVLSSRVQAQQRAVTLADAIRLSERVQPLVVRAAGDLETAAAQRRSAWGAYLPSLTASSSASSFFSEGTSRVDPVTGQLLSGNSSNRSLSTSLSASVDLFTGFRRGAEGRAARASQTAAEASFVDARFQQALETTNQFLDALAARQLLRVRESSVRRAEEQLKTSIAKLRAGSATRSDSLRSRVTLGNAQLDLIRTRTDLAAAEAGLARLIGETGRVSASDDSAFYQVGQMPDTAAIRAEAEAKSPRIQSASAVAAELTARLAELDAARLQIEITLTSVLAATEDLRVQQERYRVGASTIVDVLTSQEALNQAEVDVVVARFDYLRAKASLEALIGRTL